MMLQNDRFSAAVPEVAWEIGEGETGVGGPCTQHLALGAGQRSQHSSDRGLEKEEGPGAGHRSDRIPTVTVPLTHR